MTTAGIFLVAGFAVFLAGAAGWKLEYEAPLAERLPLRRPGRSGGQSGALMAVVKPADQT